MTKTWKTTSVRLNEEESNALRIYCEREGLTKNKLIRELVLKEIESILVTDALPEGHGIPILGEHIFKYNADKDNFTWQLDRGTQGVNVLCEDVTIKFLQHLNEQLTKSIECQKKIVGDKPVTPNKMMKYKVK